RRDVRKGSTAFCRGRGIFPRGDRTDHHPQEDLQVRGRRRSYRQLSLNRQIVSTADGSKTIRISEWDEQYHSMHGAVREAKHVFMDHGLKLFRDRNIGILEIGFGTGLNALITLLEAPGLNLGIDYVGVEAHPVSLDDIVELDYCATLGRPELEENFHGMHSAPWNQRNAVTVSFDLTKEKRTFGKSGDGIDFIPIILMPSGPGCKRDFWPRKV